MEKSLYKASIESIEGMKTIARVRNFELILDEPIEEGGFDEGMTPVEALLSSLGA
ncbi:OsmC family protein [Miniphocaeibacter halophilus]|uniref:Uncharacterized protein n=1 Tax=Miniphocaeibacter halophilus TaxID=2931922 RepID=A0AC61MR82_9FIRM|nr:hypothetical protein [Miniphocaeibacter halophilus]QQK08031.1 hypothetical protein JFY71_00390 [Miniphocaeibacter halophilus]